jgi:hypothetical protein
MNPQPLAAIDAKVERTRQLVVEEQQRAWGLHTRDDEAAKSRVLIHDLTHGYTNLKPRGPALRPRLRRRRNRETSNIGTTAYWQSSRGSLRS